MEHNQDRCKYGWWHCHCISFKLESTRYQESRCLSTWRWIAFWSLRHQKIERNFNDDVIDVCEARKDWTNEVTPMSVLFCMHLLCTISPAVDHANNAHFTFSVLHKIFLHDTAKVYSCISLLYSRDLGEMLRWTQLNLWWQWRCRWKCT